MKLIFLILMLFLVNAPAFGSDSFSIQPSQLFVDEEAPVLFRFETKSNSAESKPAFLLIEIDSKTGNPRFSWTLKDEGGRGDLQANDGIYSRVIQFKEKKPKKMEFWIVPQGSLQEGSNDLSAETLRPQILEKKFLEIQARPTFIDILKEAYYKIRNYFSKKSQ